MYLKAEVFSDRRISVARNILYNDTCGNEIPSRNSSVRSDISMTFIMANALHAHRRSPKIQVNTKGSPQNLQSPFQSSQLLLNLNFGREDPKPIWLQ